MSEIIIIKAVRAVLEEGEEAQGTHVRYYTVEADVEGNGEAPEVQLRQVAQALCKFCPLNLHNALSGLTVKIRPQRSAQRVLIASCTGYNQAIYGHTISGTLTTFLDADTTPKYVKAIYDSNPLCSVRFPTHGGNGRK